MTPRSDPKRRKQAGKRLRAARACATTWMLTALAVTLLAVRIYAAVRHHTDEFVWDEEGPSGLKVFVAVSALPALIAIVWGSQALARARLAGPGPSVRDAERGWSALRPEPGHDTMRSPRWRFRQPFACWPSIWCY